MNIFHRLFMLYLYLCTPILFVELSLFLYYAFKNTPIPSETKDPVKLRLYHVVSLLVFRLGKISERLGICSQITFVRFMLNMTPAGEKSNLSIRDTKFEHVPVRIYQPTSPFTQPRKGLIYLHGGCGIFGSNRGYERVCRHLARKSDSVVVYVEYRLGPEHQHPAQLLDCLTATTYFLNKSKDYGVDPNSIILVGESSGGALVAAVCRELVKRSTTPKIRAQILIYPFLQIMDLSLPSHQQNQFGPALTRPRAMKLGLVYMNANIQDVERLMNNAHVPEFMKMKYKKWLSADCIPEEFKARGYKPPPPIPFSKELYEQTRLNDETMLSPILDEDAIVQQLPQTYLLTCEYDLIRDDGLLYKKRLEDNNVALTWNHMKDGFHGLIMFVDTGPLEFSCTKTAIENILKFIRGL
ncbi:PREDICTED: arylacetamide deacetylase-like 4 isoform X1 [Gekko japonicus]|uniref:Arylacetamide deacetylase-like 4 isoform X1 n=2 Tax=Gekko japonicus TaxID=146911 RepID=A0ABM1KFF0_GEKJA|nr:PREDICTED: arylacetamide deacetylase-like 4 isoform X1 [Gekko japonicus]